MRCFRAKLSDRRERVALTSPGGSASESRSPRHYCQRRMANSSYDEEEWLKRYRLDTPRSNQDPQSRPSTPPGISETPEILEIGATKHVFRPAFLSICNLDLPPSVLPSGDDTTWAKRKAKYKSVPKNCSSHLHRMFVKHREREEGGRASSAASTQYDDMQFEEYLRGLNLPDDSSDCSLFEAAEEIDFSQFKNEDYDYESSNNNDVEFMNKNDEEPNTNKTNRNISFRVSAKKPKQKETPKTNSPSTSRERKMISLNLLPILNLEGHKREKRKSITLSRIPSPETTQVIRIDVITGYPVENDSVISDTSDIERSCSDDNISIDNSCKSSICSQEKIQPAASCSESKYSWKTMLNESARLKRSDTHDEYTLLNCKTVNLSSRSLNICNKSY